MERMLAGDFHIERDLVFLILTQEIEILPIKENRLIFFNFFLKKICHTKQAKKSLHKTTCGYGMISDRASGN